MADETAISQRSGDALSAEEESLDRIFLQYLLMRKGKTIQDSLHHSRRDLLRHERFPYACERAPGDAKEKSGMRNRLRDPSMVPRNIPEDL